MTVVALMGLSDFSTGSYNSSLYLYNNLTVSLNSLKCGVNIYKRKLTVVGISQTADHSHEHTSLFFSFLIPDLEVSLMTG